MSSGENSLASSAARDLIALLARDRERVRVLTLREQLEAVVDQGAHAPFEIAVGIGAAGRAGRRQIHERTGWFPRIRRVGLTREEDGRGGYRLVSTEDADLARPDRGPRGLCLARGGGRHRSSPA